MKVSLAQLTLEDFDFFKELANNPILKKELPNLIDDSSVFQKLLSSSNHTFKILYDNTKAGIILISVDERECGLTYGVLPKYHNKGIASQAVRQILEHLRSLNLVDSVYAKVSNTNYPSLKVLYNNNFEDHSIDLEYNSKGNRSFEIELYTNLFSSFKAKDISDEEFLKCKKYVNNGYSEIENNNFDKAYELITKALNINPNSPNIYALRGDSKFFKYQENLTNIFELIEATKDYTKAINGAYHGASNKEELFKLYLKRAILRNAYNNHFGAKLDLEAYLNFFGEDIKVLNFLHQINLKMSNE